MSKTLPQLVDPPENRTSPWAIALRIMPTTSITTSGRLTTRREVAARQAAICACENGVFRLRVHATRPLFSLPGLGSRAQAHRAERSPARDLESHRQGVGARLYRLRGLLVESMSL